MTVFYVIALIGSIAFLGISFHRRRKLRNSGYRAPRQAGYPYKPGIEFRLPNGRITTRGYAARNPEQFAHWARGPENVYGEYIDRGDWEDWRINYYGK